MQSGVHTRSPGLHGVWEPEGHVSQGDDEVGPDDWLHRPLQDGEQQLEMTLTELAGDQHELGEGQAGAGPQVGVRELAGVGADVEDERGDGCQQSVSVQELILTDLGKDSVKPVQRFDSNITFLMNSASASSASAPTTPMSSSSAPVLGVSIAVDLI